MRVGPETDGLVLPTCQSVQTREEHTWKVFPRHLPSPHIFLTSPVVSLPLPLHPLLLPEIQYDLPKDGLGTRRAQCQRLFGHCRQRCLLWHHCLHSDLSVLDGGRSAGASSNHTKLRLSVSLSVSLSVCLSVCLSVVCLSVCLSVCLKAVICSAGL